MHLTLAVVNLAPALPPSKGVPDSTSQEKMQSLLTLDPALPPKPPGTHRMHRDTPTQDTPSRPGYMTVSPNFIGTKKVKQNEKTEEYVPNGRTR